MKIARPLSLLPFAAALTATLLAQPIPRAEFPQPQFERKDWQNLNGRWEFEFDDANAGLAENWASGRHKFGRNITVPYCFESKLSGVADTAFHPYVWYRRTLTIPNGKQGRVLLHFGAVNYWASVWINGELVGKHEGGHVPFAFDITNLLKTGDNAIVVRSETAPTDRYIPRGKQYWAPKSAGIFYTRTSGIWQTVWLEYVPATYLESVRISSDDQGETRIYALVHNPQPGLELQTTVSLDGKAVAQTSVAAQETRVTALLSVNNPRLWSPQSPVLYQVSFTLGADKVESYTGFRSVRIENDRVTLNGRSIFLKFVLDQGYWPDSILTPPTDDAIQYDIRMTKEMGFNGARKHQKLEDPRWLYWADKMGLLVSSEMANAQSFDDAAVERFSKEWMAALDRDYNHPSIVLWVPINESWGVPNLRDPRQQNYLKQLYTLSHALDSTRPVIDNDGWEHTDMTDLFAIHDYARSGELLYEKYQDLGKPGAGVPNNGRPSLAPGYKYNGTPVVLSEFGGIAFIPPGHDVPPEAWGYSGVEKTEPDVLNRLRGLYQAIARIPGFAGLCYTQLTDVEQEINGLLTYDRKPKFPTASVREINALASGVR